MKTRIYFGDSNEIGVRRLRMLLAVVLYALISLFSGTAAAQVITFTPPDPGPPYYAVLEPGFVPHTDDWAAVIFLRETSCVPAGFNLLNVVNIPAVFSCGLDVEGHAIWKNGPPPVDFVPIQTVLHGTGNVQIWFVSWSEMESALADNVLTITELSALPSLRVGSASFFKLTQQPGPYRPQGPGNGKIELNATGTLEDGRGFSVQMREMGVDQQSTFKSMKISFGH